jgi:Kef-type K+ transport system membrane component KefB
MNINIENIEFFLFIAAIVAMLARLLKIPYTIGLVLAGIGIRTTNSNATSIGNYYCHLWGCRFFCLRSRLNYEANVASDGRN